MSMTCKLCKHPKRTQVSQWIASGKSNRLIAAHFGVSPNAVQRHRAHVKDLVKRRKAKAGEREGQTVFEKFNMLLKDAESNYRLAVGEAKLGWLRELRGWLELAYKLGIEEQARKSGILQKYQVMSPSVARLVEGVTKSLE